jgi:sensor histidine kinase YesM
MLNPVLRNTRNRIVYLLIWVIITVAHTILLHFYYNISFYYAIIDGVIYNACFLFFGLGIWYIVRYNDFELKKLMSLIAGHAVSAAFIISMWLGISGFLVSLIIKDMSYTTISNQLFPARIIYGLLYYIVIVLVYYLFVYYQNFQDKIRQEASIATRYKEAELNALKSQINPHFIFNSLNSISAMTLSDPARAQEMIVKLSDFFRLTLKKGNQHLTSLRNELQFTELYFEIEKIRFGDKLKVRIEVPDSYGHLQVPHLILQPLLENAIKHGVQESLKSVEVTLSGSHSEDFLYLILKNCFDQDLKVRGEGIGLNNIRERLRLIYGMSDLLRIDTDHEKHEFIVHLKIPLNESNG